MRRVRVDMELEDSGAFFPTVGATYRILPDNGQTLRDVVASERPLGDLVRENLRRDPELAPHGLAMAIDFDISGAQGSDSQQIHGDEFIETSDGEFDGPFVLRGDFSLQRAWVTGRVGFWWRQGWRIEGLVGVGAVAQTFETVGGGVGIDDSNSYGEFFLGSRASFYPVNAIGLYAQNSFGTLGGTKSLITVEGGLMLGPVPGVILQVGYRYWIYDEGRSGTSNVELSLGGPMVGLRFEY